jgi:hypothetical protein
LAFGHLLSGGSGDFVGLADPASGREGDLDSNCRSRRREREREQVEGWGFVERIGHARGFGRWLVWLDATRLRRGW